MFKMIKRYFANNLDTVAMVLAAANEKIFVIF